MSYARVHIDSCPDCGGTVHNEGGWPPWCPACEWGLVPESHQTPKRGRLQAWRVERMHARVLAHHQQMLGTDLRASGPRRLVGGILASLVHLMTISLLVGAVWIWTTNAFVIAKVIASALFLGIVWEVRPRFGRVPVGDNVLTRASAPSSFAVLDAVAQAVGARTPEFLVVAPHFNASVGRVGLRGRRVMAIGLPLWTALDDDQRVAVLGHECGHEVNGDIRSTRLVGTAINTLRMWSWLLRPDMRATQQRWRYGSGGNVGSLFTIAEYLVPLILLPLSVCVGLLAVGLQRIAARSGQRAEYRADELAALAAGTDTTVSTLDRFFAANSCMQSMLVAARADRRADVWAAQQRFLESVPPAQWERWRRLAAREEHRTDAGHPPTLLRQEMLWSRRRIDGRARVSSDLLAAMTDELTAFSSAVANELRQAA